MAFNGMDPRPYGYGQYSPYRDKPSPLQRAITGQPNGLQEEQPVPRGMPNFGQASENPAAAFNNVKATNHTQLPVNQPYQAKGPAMGLLGFDANKLANAEHNTPKYVFARAAQGLGMGDRDELLNRLKADPSGYFKNASWGGSKGDKLVVGGELDPKFEGINTFDVIKAAGLGGQGWQWGADMPGRGSVNRSNVASAVMRQRPRGRDNFPLVTSGEVDARNRLQPILDMLAKLRY